jgi:transposase InsO family protein
MSPELLRALEHQYARYPGWTYQLHADNLAALAGMRPELGLPVCYSTVLRTMKERGWYKKPSLPRNPSPGQIRAYDRREKREVRSYEAKYVGQLAHLDFHEGRRGVIVPDGSWHTPHLLGILDDASRLCLHGQWYLAEDTEHLVHGHDQALQKRGLPRELMTDNGSAMISEEFQNGLARLGITWSPTLPASPNQNGKQENWFVQIETRLMPMLNYVEPLTLEYLNLSTQAWIEMEYNRGFHSEIGMTPLERFLQGSSVLRPCPEPETLKVAFSVEEKRKQRRSDGTISIQAVRFEIPSRYRNFEHVIVRWQRWDLSRAYMMEPRTGKVLSTIYPVDKTKNARGVRRPLQEPVTTVDAQIQTDDDPVPPLLKKLLAEYAATGLPPAYLPKDERDAHHKDQEDKQ